MTRDIRCFFLVCFVVVSKCMSLECDSETLNVEKALEDLFENYHEHVNNNNSNISDFDVECDVSSNVNLKKRAEEALKEIASILNEDEGFRKEGVKSQEFWEKIACSLKEKFELETFGGLASKLRRLLPLLKEGDHLKEPIHEIRKAAQRFYHKDQKEKPLEDKHHVFLNLIQALIPEQRMNERCDPVKEFENIARELKEKLNYQSSFKGLALATYKVFCRMENEHPLKSIVHHILKAMCRISKSGMEDDKRNKKRKLNEITQFNDVSKQIKINMESEIFKNGESDEEFISSKDQIQDTEADSGQCSALEHFLEIMSNDFKGMPLNKNENNRKVLNSIIARTGKLYEYIFQEFCEAVDNNLKITINQYIYLHKIELEFNQFRLFMQQLIRKQRNEDRKKAYQEQKEKKIENEEIAAKEQMEIFEIAKERFEEEQRKEMQKNERNLIFLYKIRTVFSEMLVDNMSFGQLKIAVVKVKKNICSDGTFQDLKTIISEMLQDRSCDEIQKSRQILEKIIDTASRIHRKLIEEQKRLKRPLTQHEENQAIEEISLPQLRNYEAMFNTNYSDLLSGIQKK